VKLVRTQFFGSGTCLCTEATAITFRHSMVGSFDSQDGSQNSPLLRHLHFYDVVFVLFLC
jgi:hypothetical protein